RSGGTEGGAAVGHIGEPAPRHGPAGSIRRARAGERTRQPKPQGEPNVLVSEGTEELRGLQRARPSQGILDVHAVQPDRVDPDHDPGRHVRNAGRGLGLRPAWLPLHAGGVPAEPGRQRPAAARHRQERLVAAACPDPAHRGTGAVGLRGHGRKPWRQPLRSRSQGHRRGRGPGDGLTGFAVVHGHGALPAPFPLSRPVNRGCGYSGTPQPWHAVMPYDRITDLPDSVRDNVPKHAQEIYKEAFNSAWDEYKDADDRRGDASREETAHKVAWAAVK